MAMDNPIDTPTMPVQAADWDPFFQYVDYDMLCTTPTPPAAQAPTPPDSNASSPAVPAHLESDDDSLSSNVDISSTFLPGANLRPLSPDIILLSADQVLFYVHSQLLLSSSTNNFHSLLPLRQTLYDSSSSPETCPAATSDPETFSGADGLNPLGLLRMSQHSTVLNVILHAIYGISCTRYSPTIDVLVTAVEEMSDLGLPLESFISPTTSIFSLLLSHAPLNPMRLYALAGHYDHFELAAPVSSHLLSYPLSQVDDGMAERMGPIYLKRLFFLHIGRMQALKRGLLQPPRPHAPTSACNFTEQRKLTRAWALAAAHLTWDARPDTSVSSLESTLNPLIDHLTCKHCEKAMMERVNELIVQWALVKRTI